MIQDINPGAWIPCVHVSNVLSQEKKQQVIALGRLGWSLRRIQRETHIRRETAASYLKAAGIATRPPGGWGHRAPAKPAIQLITDFGAGRPSKKLSSDAAHRTARPSRTAG
jgi:hypothetical protein